MVGLSSRRGVLQGTILGVAALPLPGAFAAAQASALRIPAGPMRLTRILERGLGDGKTINVERQWAVEFLRSGSGVQVTGTQISARVDAPERLKPLAKIEEARVADGMFPLLLSHTGLLLGQGSARSAASDTSAMAQAIAVAEAMIAKSGRNPSDTAQAMRHLAQMEQASQPLFATMPRDLFFPSIAPVRDIRPVSLPDGTVGEFELIYSARAVPGSGWLASAERRILTRLGADARQSRERWSLEDMAV